MTIETPQASRPLHSTTMFANSPSVFHDYAASPINSDHSLHTDLRFPSSPNSLTMYDGDTEFLPSSLGSMCSEASFVDTGQQQEEFDLKPQFECTDNTFLHQCLDIPADGSGRDDTLVVRSDPAWSPTEASLMKMEDIFQVDQKDAIQGPTLAELNFDDSLSVYDDIVKEDEQQKRLVSGGCTLWQQSIQSGMDTTYSAPQVVLGGQKAPIKFTTCTVTSPTATAIDMRIGAVDKTTVSSSLSTLPQSLYSVTAKLSLFSEPAPVVKQEQGMDLSNRSCNATCLKVPHGSGLTLLTPHTVMPQPQPQPLAAPVANKVPTENTLSPMAMETEEPKSSLQRLLSDPLPVVIKTEPMDIPMATSVPASMWTPNAPVSAPQPMQISSSAPTVGMFAPPFGLKSTKRARSPEIETSVSTSSMEQKWEEIKQFIYDEEQSREEELAERLLLFRQRQREQQQQQQQQLPLQQPQHQPQPLQPQPQEPHQPEQQKGTEEPQTALTPSKRVKTEPKDPAFTVKDEVDSADEDIDSDPEDSDDGGDSVIGRDLDDHSDADSEFLLMDDNATSTKGPPRYFWMYNTQSKGPKGKRLCKAVNTVDPYTLNDFEDPVFDPVLNQTQYKHNGKARRGDGNDITPSPQKLYALGNELKKLNRIINDLTPVSELPAGARSKSRKEKNKLASRACRLKKKAQHEANKVKLFGLEKEHHDLLTVLSEIREKVFKMVRSGKVPTKDDYLSPMLERLMKLHLTHMIAGHTADYVNSVLAKVMSGDPAGGLAL